ncbi:MAG TPA: hypothetical protein VFE53_08885 [Mucilaginibacter sp.]|jgi:hypothetical protein|nr:hypothetical protein [Mucilaginibacter sp.]
MVNKLKGKSFWVNDNFKYNGCKEKEFEHTSREIENIVLDDNMISFFIPRCEPTDKNHAYQVNLNRRDIGTEYEGTYKDVDNPANSDDVNCDKFTNENQTRHFVYGKWTEDGTTYTWWAIFENDNLVV